MLAVAESISRLACLRMASMCSLPTSVISTNFHALSLRLLRMRTERSISASLRCTSRASWPVVAASGVPAGQASESVSSSTSISATARL